MNLRTGFAAVLFASLHSYSSAPPNLGAQSPHGLDARKVHETFQLVDVTPSRIALPALTSAALSLAREGLAPNQIGISRSDDLQRLPRLKRDALKWTQRGGRLGAQIEVSTPGAKALRVGIRFSRTPAGFELRVGRPGDSGITLFTAGELAKMSGGVVPFEFWTPTTEGPSQVIEFWAGGDKVELDFDLFDVSHFVQGPLEQVSTKALRYSCHVDVACVNNASVRDDGKAVARMVYVKNGASYVCTGALLNDRVSSFTPLFATANHCISTAAVASSLETYWFYYPASCGGTALPANRVVGGATLLLADFDTDFSLLRLARSAPSGAYFLGWDPAPLTAGAAIFGLHHPDGQAQRYMSGVFTSREPVTDAATGVRFGDPFNLVRMTQGIIEQGSSGSPLLTAPYYFRGTLFGGPSANSCSGSNNRAAYSDFAAVYPLINVYLEGPTVTDDYGNTPSTATQISPNSRFFGEINRVGDSDWFRVSIGSVGDWTISSFSASPGVNTDVIGELYASDGVTLLASNDDRVAGDTNFSMSGRVTGPGSFFVRVFGFQSTVGRYGIASSFVLTDDHGNTSGSASALGANASGNGFLGSESDSDWFRVTFNSAGTFRVESTGSTDVVGTIFQSDGVTLVAENDDANPPDRNFALTVNVLGPATAYLKVSGYGGAIGAYGLATTFTATAPTEANYTDLWWNSAESGWGINFNHQSDIIFATLFSYAGDGRNMWLVAPSLNRQSSSSFSGALYRTVGPRFNAVPWTAVTPTQVGTMTVSFTAGGTAVLTYSVNGTVVTKSIERQVFSTPVICRFTTTSRSAASNYQDLWWNSAESGWGLNLTHQGNIVFATLFTYGNDNRDVWLVGPSLTRQGDGSFSGSLYRTTGPAFNAAPWSPVNAEAVGTIRVAFSSGTTGVVSYTFAGANVSKQIERQVFGAAPTVCN